MLQEKNQNLSAIASNFKFLQAKLTFLKGYQKKNEDCSEAFALADHKEEMKINVFEPEVVVKEEPQVFVKNDAKVEDEVKNKAEDNALKNKAEDNVVKNKPEDVLKLEVEEKVGNKAEGEVKNEDKLIVKELPEVALKKGPQAQLLNKVGFVMGFLGIERSIVES